MGRPFTRWGGIVGLPHGGQRQVKEQRKDPVVLAGLRSHSLAVTSIVFCFKEVKLMFISLYCVPSKGS